MSDSYWTWGLDLGSRRAGVAVIDATGRFSTFAIEWQLPRAKPLPPGRLLLIARANMHQYARALAMSYPPSTVAYEVPSGRFPNPILMLTAGVLVEAAGDATDRVPWPLTVTEWKKQAIGAGNATKDDVHAWARALGSRTDDQEQLDALGVAAVAAEIMYGVVRAELRPDGDPMIRAAA